MISRLRGTLLSVDLAVVELLTDGGVVYEVEVPLTVQEHLPSEGDPVELRTVFVTREDSTSLYGFLETHEREIFKRLLRASGVGPNLALAMLSTFSAGRLAQALAERDVVALTQVTGVGKKKAERIVLELSEKMGDLVAAGEGKTGMPPRAEGAVTALVSLGFSLAAAHDAVRSALDTEEDLSTEELIRKALSGT